MLFASAAIPPDELQLKIDVHPIFPLSSPLPTFFPLCLFVHEIKRARFASRVRPIPHRCVQTDEKRNYRQLRGERSVPALWLLDPLNLSLRENVETINRQLNRRLRKSTTSRDSRYLITNGNQETKKIVRRGKGGVLDENSICRNKSEEKPGETWRREKKEKVKIEREREREESFGELAGIPFEKSQFLLVGNVIGKFAMKLKGGYRQLRGTSIPLLSRWDAANFMERRGLVTVRDNWKTRR